MEKIRLGRTGIVTNRNAFGALPIQRVSKEYAGMLLRKAYESGITFFDTARAYSDSEEKIGLALADVRESIVIATKTMPRTADGFWKDLEISLGLLKTDYIDLYQFHNPDSYPKPGDGSGLYEAMTEAKRQGRIRHIGITNHRYDVALAAVESGLYDTLQYPLSYLSADRDLELAARCRELDVGFIAMKALSGGLITKSDAAYAWLARLDNVLPIWGIQRETELDEFISYQERPPVLDAKLDEVIRRDREELAGSFCRGCGYCMPCPEGIQINLCARMAQLIRRSPSENWLSPSGREMMSRVESCTECGRCKTKCPYGLDIPALLKEHLADYKQILLAR